MIEEIQYTVDFISSFLINSNLNIPMTIIYKFRNDLINELVFHYKDHWFENEPSRNRNFRSILFSHHIDYLVLKAWSKTKLNIKVANLIFPINLQIFCDPKTVSYNFHNKEYILFKKTLTHLS